MPRKNTTTPRLCLDCSIGIADLHYRAKRCKPCAKQRRRDLEKERNSSLEGRERRLATYRRYRENPSNKERMRIYKVKYHGRPESKEQKRQRRSTPKAKEKSRAYQRQWRQSANGRARQSANNHRRRARKLGQAGVVSPGILIRRQDEQGGRCWYCAKLFTVQLPATIEHRIPLACGGMDDDSNIVAACYPCNAAKGAKTEVEFARWRWRLF